jgi:hypothetical protein
LNVLMSIPPRTHLWRGGGSGKRKGFSPSQQTLVL